MARQLVVCESKRTDPKFRTQEPLRDDHGERGDDPGDPQKRKEPLLDDGEDLGGGRRAANYGHGREVHALLDGRDEDLRAEEHEELGPRARLALEEALERADCRQFGKRGNCGVQAARTQRVGEGRGDGKAVDGQLDRAVVALEKVERGDPGAVLGRKRGRLVRDVARRDLGEEPGV